MARRNPKAKKQKRTVRKLKRRNSRSLTRSRAKPSKKAARKLALKRSSTSKRTRAKVRSRLAIRRKLKRDPHAEVAVREMNRGRSLTAAARDSGLPRKRLQDYVTQRRLARRKGRRWVTKDNRLRRLPVMTGGRVRILTVRGYEAAQLVGEHHNAAGNFVRTNDLNLLKPFEGGSVRAVTGRSYTLETDPNALHRIAAMDSPPFHEIYEITSNT